MLQHEKNAFPAATEKSAINQTMKTVYQTNRNPSKARIYEVYENTASMPREEWLNLRKNGVGGSDIAAILNLSRYTSRRILWLEKTGIKPQDDLSDNQAVYWGNIHEETVAREFARRTGIKVRRRQAMFRRKDKPFMLANVDRLVVGKQEGLECKTAHEYKKGEWSEEAIPNEYFLQCQWYMAVMGFERWHIAALIGGNKFFVHTVERDDKLIGLMEREAEIFWNQEVKGGNAPEWSGSDSEADYLSASYPKDQDDEPLELEPETYAGILKNYEAIKADIASLEKEKKAIENDMKELIGAREKAIVGDHVVTWSGFEQTRVDAKRMKEEDPNLYKKYAKTSYIRRFSVK